jgi:hypothetical protein
MTCSGWRGGCSGSLRSNQPACPFETGRHLFRSSLDQARAGAAVLDVVVVEHNVGVWEWRVFDRDGTTILNGFEITRRAARDSGDRALFKLLVTGWDR